MDRLPLHRRIGSWAVVVALGLASGPADAQIKVDGSLPNGHEEVLAGPDYVITPGHGYARGANLFHSFETFNLTSGMSATFFGTLDGDVPVFSRVLARVTGEASTIAGTIATDFETLGTADLYLINPNGIHFENGAKLDVHGSFVSSTAHRLQLADGGSFGALPLLESHLTAAVPSAFGFLDPGVAPIEAINVRGATTRLNVDPGKTLALVGGNVEIDQAQLGFTGVFGVPLFDPGIHVAVASVASEGEVTLHPEAPALALDADSFDALGVVTLSGASRSPATIDTSGSSAGKVWIRGGRIVLDAGRIQSTTYASDAHAIDIGAREELELTGSPQSRSLLSSQTLGLGRGAPISIRAESMRMADGSVLNLRTLPAGDEPGGGAGGALSIHVTDLLEVSGGSEILSEAQSSRLGGDVSIDAAAVLLQNGGIRTTAARSSRGGAISIVAGEVVLVDGELRTVASAPQLTAARGGDISVHTGTLTLFKTSRVESGAFSGGAGEVSGGDLYIRSGSLRIEEGAFVNSIVESATDGRGGDIHIHLAGSLEIAGEPDKPLFNAGISAANSGAVDTGQTVANGGSIFINAHRVDVSGGLINNSTQSNGDAGKIDISVRERLMLRQGGSIRSLSLMGEHDGNGGDIVIRAGDSHVEISDWRFPPDTPQRAQPGGILSQTQSRGNAGDVTIEARSLRLTNGGQILANTFWMGDAGDIDVDAQTVSVSGFNARARAKLIESSALASASGFRLDSALDRERAAGAAVAAGDAGDLLIHDFSLLKIENQGILAAGSETAGDAGSITLKGDRIEFTAETPADAPTIIAETGRDAMGERGRIDIDAYESFRSRNTNISTIGQNVGGGEISIDAPEITIGPGRGISVRSTAGGDAGSVTLTGDRIELDRAMVLSTAGDGGNGGNIGFDAGFSLIVNASSLEAKVTDGTGGNASLNAGKALVLGGGTSVIASADEADGQGGRIGLTAPAAIIAPDTVLDASAPGGPENQGVVQVNATEVDLEGVSAPLSTEFLDASAMLLASCAARRSGDRAGSFTAARWRGPPVSPEGPLFAFDALAGDSTGAGDTQRRSGQLELLAGSYQASLAALEQALELARAAGDSEREAAVLGQLGNVYTALGDGDQAGRSLEHGNRLARATEATALAASLRNSLGNLQAMRGSLTDALATYEEGVALAHRAGDALREAQAMANAARVALDLHRYDEVAERLIRAKLRANRLPVSQEQTWLLVHLARSYADLATATGTHRREGLVQAHRTLLRARAQARALGDRRTLSYAEGNLGELYTVEGGRATEALSLTHQALQAADWAEAADLSVRWYQQLGRIHWSQGDREAGIAAFTSAVAILAELRPEARPQFGRGERDRGGVEPAYLTLVDALLQASAQVEQERSQPLLHAARAAIEQLKAAELRDYFRDECVAELEAQAEPLESISSTAAVVYPILLDDRVELLLSRRAGIEQHTIRVPRSRIESTVREFRRLLGKRTTREYREPARQLYQWLIAPYAEQLAGIDTLVVVPDGALRTIPWAALHDGDGFVVERLAIAVTPSLDLIAPQPLDPQSTRMLLAGVSESVQGFSALENVPAELASIHEMYGGELLIDAQFHRERLHEELRERPPGVVHIASHAQFSGDPQTSFVLTHDDKLTMDALSRLIEANRFADEPLELLVLSACDTAAGDERAALGLAGVAVRAGARSALGSLWNVNDQATSELIVDFYRALEGPGASKAQALARAQRALLAQLRYDHPYYWASFLVINDWL